MSLFSLASVLIALAVVSSYINYRYLKLPTTVGVMSVALVVSLAIVGTLVSTRVVGGVMWLVLAWLGVVVFRHVDTFWELIDEILNVVLFLLISLDLLVWWCPRFLSGARR